MQVKHTVRAWSFAEAKRLTKSQVISALGTIIASTAAALLFGLYSSVWIGLAVTLASIVLGAIAYMIAAFARGPFVVIDNHEGRLREAERNLDLIIKPNEFLTAELRKVEARAEAAEAKLTTAESEKF